MCVYVCVFISVAVRCSYQPPEEAEQISLLVAKTWTTYGTDNTRFDTNAHTDTRQETARIKGFGSRVETLRQPIRGSMAAVTCPMTRAVISAGQPSPPLCLSAHFYFFAFPCLPGNTSWLHLSVKTFPSFSFISIAQSHPPPIPPSSPLLAVWFFWSNEPGGSQGSLRWVD